MNTLTLRSRLSDRSRQKFFVTFLAGKLLGLALAFLAIKSLGPWIMAHAAHAAGLAPQEGETIDQVVSATNTTWVLVTAFLVFFMQAGFMMLEAGFARTREVVNILVECIVDTCLCAILFWAFGFAFMFGEGNGFIGH